MCVLTKEQTTGGSSPRKVCSMVDFPNRKIVRPKDIEAETGLPLRSVYDEMDRGRFPQQVQLAKRSSAGSATRSLPGVRRSGASATSGCRKVCHPSTSHRQIRRRNARAAPPKPPPRWRRRTLKTNEPARLRDTAGSKRVWAFGNARLLAHRPPQSHRRHREVTPMSQLDISRQKHGAGLSGIGFRRSTDRAACVASSISTSVLAA